MAPVGQLSLSVETRPTPPPAGRADPHCSSAWHGLSKKRRWVDWRLALRPLLPPAHACRGASQQVAARQLAPALTPESRSVAMCLLRVSGASASSALEARPDLSGQEGPGAGQDPDPEPLIHKVDRLERLMQILLMAPAVRGVRAGISLWKGWGRLLVCVHCVEAQGG